jgi:hypothetical protein
MRLNESAKRRLAAQLENTFKAAPAQDLWTVMASAIVEIVDEEIEAREQQLVEEWKPPPGVYHHEADAMFDQKAEIWGKPTDG